jgi:hypothetical protein
VLPSGTKAFMPDEIEAASSLSAPSRAGACRRDRRPDFAMDSEMNGVAATIAFGAIDAGASQALITAKNRFYTIRRRWHLRRDYHHCGRVIIHSTPGKFSREADMKRCRENQADKEA